MDNTLIVVTSDNSMPFPRFKGHPYEMSTHIPFTVMWPGKIKNPGRKTDKFMSFIDLAPTFLEVAGVSSKVSGMQPFEGQSLSDFFRNEVSGRDHVITGRERNDIGRPQDQGYPVRSLNNGKYYYMHNFAADRWPCGNPETGYKDTDDSPTKTFALKGGAGSLAYDKCFGKKQADELYDLEVDPECLNNLATNPEYKPLLEKMKNTLFSELKTQKDPRMLGQGQVFDNYVHSKKAGYYEDFMKSKSGVKSESTKN
jgi:N-sulfoglucosamine sulfohydrolase